jgi:two-component system, NarL family, sensor kinase
MVAPRLTDDLVRGDQSAIDDLDAFVTSRVLPLEPSIVRVKIWSRDGRIVYSDESRLIGASYPLAADELQAFESRRVNAELSDLRAEENRFERGRGRLLEVYLPVRTRSGAQEVLFEIYVRYSSVAADARAIWTDFAPALIGALMLLWLIQLPLAWTLLRRLRRGQLEREALFIQAMEASESERRRIAGNLHDGVVQDLAGTSFALSATARDLTDRPETAGRLESLGMGVRQSLRALRSLLVEIYPPDLRTEGLGAALDDLVAPAAAAGIDVELHVADTTAVPDDVVALAWRTAQEAVRNALRHGSPGRLTVGLTVDRPGDRAGDRSDRTGSGTLVLEVRDDGIGFDAHQPPQQGHLGLRGLSDLVHEAGGRLEVTSAPGAGTRVRLEVPTT